MNIGQIFIIHEPDQTVKNIKQMLEQKPEQTISKCMIYKHLKLSNIYSYWSCVFSSVPMLYMCLRYITFDWAYININVLHNIDILEINDIDYSNILVHTISFKTRDMCDISVQEEIITLINKTRDMEIFYKTFINNSISANTVTLFIHKHVYNNKIDVQKYTDTLIVHIVETHLCLSMYHEIQKMGIYFTQTQIKYYNMVNNEKTYMCVYQKYLSTLKNNHTDINSVYFAFRRCRYKSINVDDNMYDAYKNNNIKYILEHEHVPDYKCVYLSVMFSPDTRMERLESLVRDYEPIEDELNTMIYNEETMYKLHTFDVNHLEDHDTINVVLNTTTQFVYELSDKANVGIIRQQLRKELLNVVEDNNGYIINTTYLQTFTEIYNDTLIFETNNYIDYLISKYSDNKLY